MSHDAAPDVTVVPPGQALSGQVPPGQVPPERVVPLTPRAVELAERLHALLDEIAETSTADCTDAQLLGVVAEHERAARRLESIGLRDYIDTSDRDAYRIAGYTSIHAFYTGVLNLSHGAARQRRLRAAKLGTLTNLQGEVLAPALPDTAQALAEGAISGAHVDVILDTLRRIPNAVSAIEREVAESTLAHYARDFAPPSLRRLGVGILAHLDPDGSLTDDRDRKRERSLNLSTQDAQLMSRLLGNLDPMTRAMFDVVLAVWGAPGVNNPDDPESPTGDPHAVDPDVLAAAAARDTRALHQRHHDALAAVLRVITEGGHLGANHHGLPPQIIVTVTESRLREAAGSPAPTATGALLPIHDVVELAAKAQTHLAVFADHSAQVLYFGRSRRLASRAQRLALIARDGAGCTRPNCTKPAFDSQVHHLTDFQHGGRTDIDDLAIACGPDNRHVGPEPGKWTTTMHTDGADAGRPAWHPPPANPRPDRIINHANLPTVLVERMRKRVAQRYRNHDRPHDRTEDADAPDSAAPTT